MNINDIDIIMSYENLYFGQTLGKNHFEIELKSDTSYFLVLENDLKEIIGYISSTVDEYAEILNFFIKDSERGKGLGEKLLNEVIKEATLRKCKSIYLEVNVNNANAIALYKKCGFIVDHIRKAYYKDTDAYAMIKEL